MCRTVVKFLCILDASKAFEKVVHHGLFVELIKGIPPVLTVTVDVYCRTGIRMSCSVLWNSVLGNVFLCKLCCPSRSVLSPILFPHVYDLIGTALCVDSTPRWLVTAVAVHRRLSI